MGTVTADVGMSDTELFDSAMTDAPAQATAPETVEATQEQPEITRDEHGRFAPKQADEPQAGDEAQQQAGAERKEPPEFRFREVSEAKRQAEEQAKALAEQNRQLMAMLQQFQKPQQPAEPAPQPVVWEDPDAWAQHILSPVSEQVRQTREYFSRQLAEQRHGAEKVREAHDALKAAIASGEVDGKAVVADLNNQMDPYGKILEWHQERTIRQEIGTDPKAYQQKVIEQFINDPANAGRIAEMMRSQQAGGQAQQAQAGKPSSVIDLPPSLNRQTSAASDAVDSGGMSDAELFSFATARR